MTDTSGARLGVPTTSMRPAFSGERVGLTVAERQHLDALQTGLDLGPEHRTDFLVLGHQGRLDDALGLARASGAPRP